MSVQTDLWDQQVADITTLVKRPDLTAEIQLAVRMGTLRAHLSDTYVRDLVTTQTPVLTASQTLLQVATSTTLQRFRGVSQVQLLDVNGNVLDQPEIECVEPGEIYEPGYDGVRKPYIAWLAGTALNIYAASGMYGAQIVWYQSPNVTRATYDSWIAQLFPDIVVWEGAYYLWTLTGNQEKAAAAYKILHGTPGSDDLGLYQMLDTSYTNSTIR